MLENELGGPPLPPRPPPAGLHTPGASTKQEGQTRWEAQSCPHILAKVKENPENFRKKIPNFSETFQLQDLNYIVFKNHE